MDMSTAIDAADVQSGTDTDPQNRAEPLGGSSLRPREDGTARQIFQLLQEMQTPEIQPPSILGENPCIPFFYRPDENDEVKIMVVWEISLVSFSWIEGGENSGFTASLSDAQTFWVWAFVVIYFSRLFCFVSSLLSGSSKYLFVLLIQIGWW